MIKKCLRCGKDFETSHRGAKYCSYLCYRLHVKEQMNSPEYKEEEVIETP
ncbi:MAG: hypothetical protein ACTSW1_14150 [Candidatus Hodarchaeales archaeon]